VRLTPRISLPLSIEEIEIAAKGFKETCSTKPARYIRRHNSSGALAALEAAEYVDKPISLGHARIATRLRARLMHLPMIEQRDAEMDARRAGNSRQNLDSGARREVACAEP